MIQQWFVAGKTPAFEGKQLGYAGPSVGVSGQRLLVMGGANFPDKMPWRGGAKRYYDLVSIFSRSADGHLQCEKSEHLAATFGYAATCTTPEGVAVIGGENADGARAEAALYFLKDGAVQTRALPNLPKKMTNGQVVYVDGKLYFAGGENADAVSRAVWVLDLAKADAWQPLADLPQPTACGVMLAKNGFLYMFGGRMRQAGGLSRFYQTTFAYEIAKNEWSEKAPLPGPLAAGSGVVVGSKLLLLSGDAGEFFHKAETLINAIAVEKDEAKKAQMNEEKALLQESHPGFTPAVLAYDPAANSWQEVSKIPFPGQVTTGSLVWDDSIYIVNGEIRAGVRTPQITGATLAPSSK